MRLSWAICAAAVTLIASHTAAAEAPSREAVHEAMVRATRYMAENVAYKGGYVELYTLDLSERWGEIPAWESMVWVQDYGTVSMGRTFLEAYRATSDPYFLEQARDAADVLVYGQHPAGGWHYFIDFNPSQIEQWYEEVGKKCWGWLEYSHYYGNCTFDDNVTAGATEYLLALYLETLDPQYRDPLLKALEFILDAQYPVGGWPQRYPLKADHPADGNPDYTPFHTFNDDVIVGNTRLLTKAYEALGDPRYREAALRGMHFAALVQMPPPQAGWADQYDMDLRPAPGRAYEPACVLPSLTRTLVLELLGFYKQTGDRRFLRGIPDALDWLDGPGRLPEGHADPPYTHATFVELDTNRPLYPHREGKTIDEGRYWIDYEPVNLLPGYGLFTVINVDALRREYERVAALTPAESRAEYVRQRAPQAPSAPNPAPVQAVLDALDDQGRWVEELTIPDYDNYIENPPRTFTGISTRTFSTNMATLTAYLAAAK